VLCTSCHPGAIAIVQLVGEVEPLLRSVTGQTDWPIGRMRLANMGGIDEGLVARVAENVAQLMPHGGPRVVQRLIAHLIDLGSEIDGADDQSVDPMLLYPEAVDRLEALMLAALARAQSSLAIELLLDQPRRWRAFIATSGECSIEDRERSRRLHRLIDPPIVVLAGLPNIGKSTLSNALLGRAMSITLDQPGTTRDYTAGLIDLAGLVVQWHDTPGIRRSDDVLEQRSIEVAARLIERADLLIAMTDAARIGEGASAWPELPRKPDLRVVNKCDLRNDALDSNSDAQGVHAISARTGAGLVELVAGVRNCLMPPDDLACMRPWLFDDRIAPPHSVSH
jgi:tRNA modification GTPase